MTVDSSRRGDLAIFLTSPHGTKSQLLARRPHDSSRAGFHDWPFLTVFSWGENPAGTWELEVQNDGRYEVTLRAWSMTFHGTKDDPDQSQLPPPPTYPPSPSPSPTPAPIKLEPSPKSVEPPKVPESVPYHAPVSPTASIDYCTKLARPGWCQECEVGYRILAGRCVKTCPVEGYYEVHYAWIDAYISANYSIIKLSQATQRACTYLHEYLELCTQLMGFDFCMDSPLTF